MLRLNGTKIESFFMFNKYFNFGEIYKLLCDENAYLFYDFCRKVLTDLNTQVAFQKVVGIKRTNGDTNPDTGIQRLIKNPSRCLEEELPLIPGKTESDGIVFERCGDRNGNNVLVKFKNTDYFTNVILYTIQTNYIKLHPEFAAGNQVNNPVWNELQSSVKNAMNELTENGGRQFPPEAAVELYVYFLLHGLAAVKPDADMSKIRQDLDRLCPITTMSKIQKDLFVLQSDERGITYLPLMYYDGKTDSDRPLTIVELKNNSESMIKVVVKDTVLFRYVEANNSIYVLRKGSQFIAFIPRFRLINQVVTRCLDGKLYEVWNEKWQEVKTSITKPVMWVQNGEYGIFIVDKTGKMDNDTAWPHQIPNQPIVMVDAYALDYCFLFSDGTIMSALQKQAWSQQPLISISLGLNSAIAISDSRQPILNDGRKIQNIRASEAKTYCDHYICLTRDGKVVTDSGLSVKKVVYSIAVCRYGYVLAYKDKICLYDYRNYLCRDWSVPDATELEADDSGLVYYDGCNGDIKSIFFQDLG